MPATATRTARPKFKADAVSAAVGRVVMVEEELAELREMLAEAREQIAALTSQARFLTERLAALTRPRELLTEKEVAELLRVHVQTLKGWRAERPTPRIPFIVMEGGDIRYRVDVIDAYLQSRERRGQKKAV